MKYCLFFWWLFFLHKLNGQTNAVTEYFEKSITRDFNIPAVSYSDSCYYVSTLLRVKIDKKSKITFLAFSDNAENWMVDELDRVSKKWDFKIISEFVQKNRIKNESIIVPIVIRSGTFSCKSEANSYRGQKKYFQFDEQNLRSKIFLVNPVEIILFSPEH